MSQRVKDIVNLLKKDGHPSVLEHKTVFRPWGSYTVLYRLENPGKIPLEIIEVQSGEYLEEDDIVRFDDICGRE